MDGRERLKTNNDGEERFFNFRPCLFLALFLALGILLARWFLGNGVSVWWSAVVFALPLLFFAYFKKKAALYTGLALAFCFIVGVTSYTVRANAFTDTTFYNDYGLTVYGRVIEKTEKGEETSLIVSQVYIDGKMEKGKLVAYLPASSCENVRLSDLVFIQGRVRTSVELFGKNATFEEYFADDIRFYAEAERISVSGHKSDLFLEMKDLLRARLYEGMGEDAAAVSFAIMTGDSSGIDSGLLNNVRRGGIAHIFAVSGLHIGTLYAVCIFLFKKLKLFQGKNFIRFCLIAATLILYGGLCGYSESVVRATVMCLTLYLSKVIGVKRDGVESVSLAALLVLLINPVSLFCVGAQLSFAACYGIFFLGKELETAMERKFRAVIKSEEEYPVSYTRGARGKLFSFLSVTVSAQLATTPVLLNAYGYLSAWALLLNVLFVPCVGFIFSLTLGCSLLACALPSFISSVFLWLPNLLWTSGLLIFQIFNFSVLFKGVTFSGLAILCYYLLLTVLSGKFNLKRKEKMLFSLILALLCVCAFIIIIL